MFVQSSKVYLYCVLMCVFFQFFKEPIESPDQPGRQCEKRVQQEDHSPHCQVYSQHQVQGKKLHQYINHYLIHSLAFTHIHGQKIYDVDVKFGNNINTKLNRLISSNIIIVAKNCVSKLSLTINRFNFVVFFISQDQKKKMLILLILLILFPNYTYIIQIYAMIIG